MVALTALLSLALLQAHSPTDPLSRMNEDWWKLRHENCIETTRKGGFELAFLGDSITQGWEGTGKEVWNNYYASRKAANFGFSGDRTENVLWRLANGELVGSSPKVIVIMIGTNNVGAGSVTPKETAQGVKAIVDALREKIPSAEILLLGVFPRAQTKDDPLRLRVNQINSTISHFAGEHVHYLDIGKYFLSSNGELRTALMPDLLHPNAEGYAIWQKAMEATLDQLLGAKR
jgi:lysophospholipase L1-like esterase